MQEYSIGQISRRTGIKVTTIRYYESRGLIEAPGRTQGGQRRYDAPALERLLFLRHARELGFALDDIAELLALADRPAGNCAPAHAIARKQLAAVDRRISSLNKVRRELARLAYSQDPGEVGGCRVIEVLGDHSLCIGEHSELDGPDTHIPRCKD